MGSILDDTISKNTKSDWVLVTPEQIIWNELQEVKREIKSLRKELSAVLKTGVLK